MSTATSTNNDAHRTELLEQYELSRTTWESEQHPRADSTTTSVDRALSEASLQITSEQAGMNVQELAPIDRGIKAWTFCFCSFVLEMTTWGFCFRYVSAASVYFLTGMLIWDTSAVIVSSKVSRTVRPT